MHTIDRLFCVADKCFVASQSVVDEWASSLFRVSSIFGPFYFHLNLLNVNNEKIVLTDFTMSKMIGNGLSGRGS